MWALVVLNDYKSKILAFVAVVVMASTDRRAPVLSRVIVWALMFLIGYFEDRLRRIPFYADLPHPYTEAVILIGLACLLAYVLTPKILLDDLKRKAVSRDVQVFTQTAVQGAVIVAAGLAMLWYLGVLDAIPFVSDK